jgi:phenylalanyl-tRNA synthetase beta chain
MSADLVEEAARLIGFDRLPQKDPPRAPGLRAPALAEGESRLRLARRALAASGYLECVSWSFCSQADAKLFGGGADALVLANPIAAELDCMRPSALPNLLRIAQKNLNRGFADARLFEAGPAYRGDGETEQDRRVAGVWQARPQRHWKAQAAPDVFDAKRDCLLALEAMGAPVASLQQAANPEPWAHPGRSGAFKLGPKLVAAFGEVHPKTLAALDVEGPVLAFEIFVDALPALKAKGSRARPPLARSDQMPLKRDFAFLVDEAKPAADLVRAAYGADKALIADVILFDLYRGQGVPEGKKSLAIEVTLQPKDKTLTDVEIEDVGKKVIASVMKATGGVLRA